VRAISHRTCVMYAGRIVESGPTEVVLQRPKHPYTQALIEAAPLTDPLIQRAKLHATAIGTPTQAAAQGGCPYRSTCPRRIELCEQQLPAIVATEADPDHSVACHRPHNDLEA